MSKFDPLKVHFLDTRTVHLSITSPKYKGRSLEPDDFRKYEYRTGYLLELNEQEDLARITLEVEIRGLPQGTKSMKKIGRIATESYFHLVDFRDWLVQEPDKYGEPRLYLDRVMIHALLSLAYSTTRGILIARSAGTVLQKAVLPVVAPAQLPELGTDNPKP